MTQRGLNEGGENVSEKRGTGAKYITDCKLLTDLVSRFLSTVGFAVTVSKKKKNKEALVIVCSFSLERRHESTSHTHTVLHTLCNTTEKTTTQTWSQLGRHSRSTAINDRQWRKRRRKKEQPALAVMFRSAGQNNLPKCVCVRLKVVGKNQKRTCAVRYLAGQCNVWDGQVLQQSSKSRKKKKAVSSKTKANQEDHLWH